MKDATGIEIESGDFLFELNGGYSQIHIAFSGFTPTSVRTVIPCWHYSLYGANNNLNYNNTNLYKTRVKPKHLIIITKEQVEAFMERRILSLTLSLENKVGNPNSNTTQQNMDDSIEFVEKSLSSFREFSKLLKEEGDITELLKITK